MEGSSEALTSSPLTIDNNIISNFSQGITFSIGLYPNTVSVSGNTIDTTSDGISFNNDIICTGLTVDGNTITGFEDAGIVFNNGIDTYSSEFPLNLSISRNNVNALDFYGYIGIFLGYAYSLGDVNIDSNTVQSPNEMGEGMYIGNMNGYNVDSKRAREQRVSVDKSLTPKERMHKAAARIQEELLAQKNRKKGERISSLRKKTVHNSTATLSPQIGTLSISGNSISSALIEEDGINNADGNDYFASITIAGNIIENTSTDDWGMLGCYFTISNTLSHTVINNTISGFSNGIHYEVYSDNLDGSETINISTNTITNRDGSGLDIAVYPGETTRMNLNVDHNTILDELASPGGAAGESGIEINGIAVQDTVQQCIRVSSNTIEGYGSGIGINCWYFDSLKVTGNTTTNCVYGIGNELRSLTSFEVTGNNVTEGGDFGGAGYYLYCRVDRELPSTALISNNDFSRQTEGMNLTTQADSGASASITIESNNFSDAAGSGVTLNLNTGEPDDTLPANVQVTFRFNDVRNCGGGLVIYNINRPTPVVNYNNMYGNGGFDLVISNFFAKSGLAATQASLQNVNAKYNYWGTATTTEMNAGNNPKNIIKIKDFFDDALLGTADYTGWLQDSVPAGTTGMVTGTVFSDKNTNGVKDSLETAIPNWQLTLAGAGSKTTTTDAQGNYLFFLGGSGAYTVSQTVQPGWSKTFPAGANYALNYTAHSSLAGKDFGNFYDTTKFRTFNSANPATVNFAAKVGKLAAKGKGKTTAPYMLVPSGQIDMRMALENVFLKRNKVVPTITFGVPLATTEKTLLKDHGWLAFKTSKALCTFFNPRQTDSSYAIDSLAHGTKTKAIAKAYTPVSSKQVKTNYIWGEGTMLKLNLLASQIGITPEGFGNLQLDTAVTLFGRNLNGMSLVKFAGYVDTLMTFWREQHVYALDSAHGIVNSTLAEHAAYAMLNRIAGMLQRINDGFYRAAIDTVRDTTDLAHQTKWIYKTRASGHDYISYDSVKTGKNAYGLWLSGYKTAKEAVSFLKHVPSTKLELMEFTDAGIAGEMPNSFEVSQNYPNPFNPTTSINVSIPQGLDGARATMKVYDVLGREVATLINGEAITAGVTQVTFDASHFASGVYFYRVDVNNGEFTSMKKMVLLK